MFRAIQSAILLACVAGTQLPAQLGQAFRSNAEIVVVPFTVVDARGAAVGGLTSDEFRVYADDARRPVENLWVDDDVPLRLGIIIDSSESQKDQVSEHRQTVVQLLRRILRTGDAFFVISVDEGVRLQTDLREATGNFRDSISEGPGTPLGDPCLKPGSARGLRPIPACGPSPLWDAIYDAARLKLQLVTGNKALLILTDGFDSGSAHSWRQAADAANRADAPLYAFEYRSAFGGNFAPDLYRLVAEAGGTWFSAPGGEYGPIVSRLETDLRHRYVVGFRPDPLSGKVRHEIRIEVTHPDLTVRSRKTYFQDPE